MDDRLFAMQDGLGWSGEPWGNATAEDMLLREVSFNALSSSLDITLTYDGYELEGAPIGDWTVELVGLSDFNITRLEGESASASGAINATVVSDSEYALFSDELDLRAGATTARIRRYDAGAISGPPFLSPASTNKVLADETMEWTTAEWSKSETQLWDCVLNRVSFDVRARSIIVSVTEVGPGHAQGAGETLLEVSNISSFGIVSRDLRNFDEMSRAFEIGFVNGARYSLYHPQLALFATVD